MSGALDPSAPGLPIVPSGGGGGASIPVTDPADLLAGATPSRLMATDSSGDGALVTYPATSEALAFQLAHTQPSATMRFLWRFAASGATIANLGTVSGADLAVGGTSTQNALLLASLNGPGLSCDGTSGSSARGGTNKTPGIATGLTWWCVFTVITPPPARRASVFVRNAAVPWASPYMSVAINIDSATAPAARSIVVVVAGQSSGYLEHIVTPRYTDGTQVSVVATLNGSAWKVYVNGVLSDTYADGESVDWGDGTGDWQVGANASGEEATVHVTEAGVDARVWTADDVIELEQRRLGRWRG